MTERLAQILGMLGSAHDGEVINAARAAKRELDKSGKTFADLAKGEAGPPRMVDNMRYADLQRTIRMQLDRIKALEEQDRNRAKTIAAKDVTLAANAVQIRTLTRERDEAVGKLKQAELFPDAPRRQEIAQASVAAMIGVLSTHVPKECREGLAHAAHVLASGRKLDGAHLANVEAAYALATAAAAKAAAQAAGADKPKPKGLSLTKWIELRIRDTGFGHNVASYWAGLQDAERAAWYAAETRAHGRGDPGAQNHDRRRDPIDFDGGAHAEDVRETLNRMFEDKLRAAGRSGIWGGATQT